MAICWPCLLPSLPSPPIKAVPKNLRTLIGCSNWRHWKNRDVSKKTKKPSSLISEHMYTYKQSKSSLERGGEGVWLIFTFLVSHPTPFSSSLSVRMTLGGPRKGKMEKFLPMNSFHLWLHSSYPLTFHIDYVWVPICIIAPHQSFTTDIKIHWFRKQKGGGPLKIHWLRKENIFAHLVARLSYYTETSKWLFHRLSKQMKEAWQWSIQL